MVSHGPGAPRTRAAGPGGRILEGVMSSEHATLHRRTCHLPDARTRPDGRRRRRPRRCWRKRGNSTASRPPTIAVLMNVSDPALLGELFAAAQHVKDTIYGRRLVLFAPLYVSNMCANECTYCAFRARNTCARPARPVAGGDRRRGADPDRPGAQARAAGRRRVVSARGVLVRPRVHRHDLRRDARHGRDAPRQRERGAADARRVPGAEGAPDRHLPAVPGDLSPPDLLRRCTSAGRSATTTGA